MPGPILVEVQESLFSDRMSEQRELIDTIRRQLSSELGIGVAVKLVEEKTLERFEGKGQRVIDKREI